ncbi:hypothetical protein KUTeg_020270 [Tegillarca granosa]|uniref:Uncharacterized protein n=1 Tax=Tegillarca granosa TaxID=220873 RepID=A0ABQ9E7D5_TEGGR|nr:hypothetical protein KUTeg_020270 [Tegillarca granosa]
MVVVQENVYSKQRFGVLPPIVPVMPLPMSTLAPVREGIVFPEPLVTHSIEESMDTSQEPQYVIPVQEKKIPSDLSQKVKIPSDLSQKVVKYKFLRVPSDSIVRNLSKKIPSDLSQKVLKYKFLRVPSDSIVRNLSKKIPSDLSQKVKVLSDLSQNFVSLKIWSGIFPKLKYFAQFFTQNFFSNLNFVCPVRKMIRTFVSDALQLKIPLNVGFKRIHKNMSGWNHIARYRPGKGSSKGSRMTSRIHSQSASRSNSQSIQSRENLLPNIKNSFIKLTCSTSGIMSALTITRFAISLRGREGSQDNIVFTVLYFCIHHLGGGGGGDFQLNVADMMSFSN